MLQVCRRPLTQLPRATLTAAIASRSYTVGTTPLNGFEKFQQREQAKENFFIRQHEKEQMEEQVKEYKKQIKHLNSKIDEIEKEHSKKQKK